MNALYRASRVLVAAALMLGLAACNEAEQSEQLLEPVAFHSSDECHVCGMVISDFPGPKGQAVEKGGVRKFCSTAEMLGWWLQPKSRPLPPPSDTLGRPGRDCAEQGGSPAGPRANHQKHTHPF